MFAGFVEVNDDEELAIIEAISSRDIGDEFSLCDKDLFEEQKEMTSGSILDYIEGLFD